MKNRLIALIDFSVYANALIDLTTRWREISQAQLVLVHQVAGLYPSLADPSSRKEIIQHEKDLALSKLKDLIRGKNLDESEIDYLVTELALLDAIAELQKEKFNDIILVGIRGVGMLKQLLMGHTATQVIDEVNSTVIAVPAKLCAVPDSYCNLIPRRLVVALNYRFPLNENAFDNFVSRYRKAIEEIDFISSMDDDHEEEDNVALYLGNLAEKYKQMCRTSHRIFKGVKHFELLKSYVRSEPDTILVVQRGSRTLTDHLFRKFMINEIIHDGSLPLAVLAKLETSSE